MTMLTPATAREYWGALVENAAHLVADADRLFPSPRSQSLVVLAHEEIGKAAWVSKAFWKAWHGGDVTSPIEVPELDEHGTHHIPKLKSAYESVSDDEARFVLTGDALAEWEAEREAWNHGWARADNLAKQRGFYVDLDGNGGFTTPDTVPRPGLRLDMWAAADSVLWTIHEAQFGASVSKTREVMPDLSEAEAMVKAVTEKYWDG